MYDEILPRNWHIFFIRNFELYAIIINERTCPNDVMNVKICVLHTSLKKIQADFHKLSVLPIF